MGGRSLVNLHPLFLFWKHGSVCEPEKKCPKYGLQKQGAKKNKVIFIQKENYNYTHLIVSTTETPLPSYKSWRVRYFYMLHIFSIWLATPKPVLFWIVQTLHRLFSIYFRKSGSKKKHPKHGGNEPVLCMSPHQKRKSLPFSLFFRKVHFWCNFYQVCGRQEESRYSFSVLIFASCPI